jgi:ATP phosphoribosyltransferase regulatory subunit
VRSLAAAGVTSVRIDLCHAAIVPALLALNGGAEELDVETLYALLRGKDVPGLADWLRDAPAALRDALQVLPRLHGRVAADAPLARARAALPDAEPVSAALDQLERLCASPLWRRWPGVELSIDLADLRGYRYHNGVTFAAYVEALPYAIARGGRYDGIGRAFGRARPATGFSIELRALAGLAEEAAPMPAIRAPWSDDAALIERIAALRADGDVVIQVLPGHEHQQQEFACDRELVMQDGRWTVRPLATGRHARRT